MRVLFTLHYWKYGGMAVWFVVRATTNPPPMKATQGSSFPDVCWIENFRQELPPSEAIECGSLISKLGSFRFI